MKFRNIFSNHMKKISWWEFWAHFIRVTNNCEVIDKSIKPNIYRLRRITGDFDPPMNSLGGSRDRYLSFSLIQLLQNFVKYTRRGDRGLSWGCPFPDLIFDLLSDSKNVVFFFN